MDLGFETIGNACLILHDGGPVLATDPWLSGTAYFGSWILSHEVPAEQQSNVRACSWLWISHGHPDHLSLPSLEQLRDKTILLPDHHGGRVARDLRELGFEVVATRGTQRVLSAHGIEAATVNKVAEGRPHIVDMIKNGEVSFIVNTVEDSRTAQSDSRSIRVTALAQRVTYYTTIAGARAACNGMRALAELRPYRLQELHAQLR